MPVESGTAPSLANYTMPTSDKIYNEKWPNPNPWNGFGINSADYEILSYEEKLTFYDDHLNLAQKQAVADTSYERSLIFYVGHESGIPADKGYLYFKRADDSGTPINAFGKEFYGNNRKISVDISEIQDPVTSKIVVTVTINLWEGEKKVRSINNSFELVNIDADADGDKFDDWDKDEDDIEITGATDPTHYYICKDIKYFDWGD
jgi:hypothetical protein